MDMATATLSLVKTAAVGDRLHARAKVTESGTYSTGGTSITAQSLGLKYVEQLIVTREPTAANDQAWDGTPGTSVKVLSFTDGGTEVQHTVSSTTSAYYILAIGF